MNTRPSWPSWRQTQQTQGQGITKLCMALLLACCLLLTFPGSSSAHAVLVRSDPTQGAVLRAPPGQVRLWFSEDLNPSLCTAQVLDGANQRRVDSHDAHRSPGDTLEMDVSLEPHLPPAVYVVIWRTVSNVDGHVLGGSFLFTVSRPDGSIPSMSEGRISGQTGQTAPGTSAFSGSSRGQLDGVTLFNFLMVTLVELGAVFWVGAQFWLLLVLQPAAEDHAELTALHQQAQLRFERRLSLPTLLALLLANGGVLIGQAVTLTGGNVPAAFAFSVLFSLLSSGGFGAYWIMRVLTLSLLLALALYRVQHRVQSKAPSRQTTVFSWTQVLLGLALFIAMTMSSHAAAAGPSTRVYAAVADWLHLVAAALWVGGMFSIATCYVPVLRHRPVAERAHALVTVLPYSSLWAVVGVLLMAVTGPLSATVELSSWEQFLITVYGRVLAVKILLVGVMLLTSAFHVFLLRPHLQKEEMKYALASVRLPSSETETAPNHFTESSVRQVKLREGRQGRLAALTQRLTTVLRYEPMLGVAVLVCVGLLNVFAGTLAPSAAPTAKASPSIPTASWQTTARTSDERFTFTLTVSPKQAGPNTFTVSVVDNRTGKPTTQVGISLYTKYLEKDLGTATVNLQPDGKGHFSASGDLTLGGHWQIRVQIRTVQNTLHEATITFVTS
ncbi:copper resistance protein CopC/CopD [Ktedonobacteria bacterium brp13]|nr:copper resistance protein CopC/CopD [Ktedonobacteria bacterium brp13]